MSNFEQKYEKWIEHNLANETNPRRREQLLKGLSHGTIRFLKSVWYPAVGNFNNLFPEWEVRDSFNKYRYLDLAYMPSGAKGAIEIPGLRLSCQRFRCGPIQRSMQKTFPIVPRQLDFSFHCIPFYHR